MPYNTHCAETRRALAVVTQLRPEGFYTRIPLSLDYCCAKRANSILLTPQTQFELADVLCFCRAILLRYTKIQKERTYSSLTGIVGLNAMSSLQSSEMESMSKRITELESELKQKVTDYTENSDP